ncbi:MAG: TraB/GumN family protein [Cellvibrio sp.]
MGRVIRILGLLAGLVFSEHLFAKSMVYEITEGKNKIYLAGTIHLLRSQDFPPPAEFDAAYQQSQKIYFETDIQIANSPEFGQRFAHAMLLPNNTTLKDVLSAATWAELQSFSEKNQFPLSQTMMFNPAMMSLLITIHEAKKIGAGDGVDVYYDKSARSDKKFTGELETANDVIGYMKNFDLEDPNKTIKSTLSDAEFIEKDLGKMISAWKAGDLDTLEKEMGEKMRKETPNIHKALVVDRNQKWFPKIERMFESPEVEMVLVGSLHLPGKDGLLTSLKKAGYKVKPYEIKNNSR